MSQNDQNVEFVLDTEDWEVAFEAYKGHPFAALQLAFHFTELKQEINSLRMHEALAAIDRAVDCLYAHSEFRIVSRDLFLTAIEGRLTTDREELLRQLGIRI
jgi:hypothetical protein